MFGSTAVLIFGLVAIPLVVFLYWPERGWLAYQRRNRDFAHRVLREDALKHLYKFEVEGFVSTLESVAGALQTSTDRVALLLVELEDAELTVCQGGTCHLTPAGRDYALHIIRVHRLWERHLAERTGFGELEWHRQAESMEHLLSFKEAESLAIELGYPPSDPHGDPIPDRNGHLASIECSSLSEAPIHSYVQIIHMEDEPETVYAQLLAEGLRPGMTLFLSEKNARLVRFWADGKELVLAPLLANNISVREVQTALDPTQTARRLAELSPGESAVVLQLSPAIRGLERRRLLDLGIVPGTSILAELKAPGDDPIAYRVRDTLIALRRKQADQILLEAKPSQEEAV